MKFLTDYDPQKKRVCSIEPMTMMLGGSALASLGGNIFGSVFGSSASKKQAEAIREAAEKAKQTAIHLNDKAWTNYGNYSRDFAAPIFGRGNEAGNQLMALLSGSSDITKRLEESDLFKFESNLGQRDINRQLKARGLYGSGAGLEALTRFSTELTAKEGQRHWDRLIQGYGSIMQQGTAVANQALSGAAGLAGATSGLGGQIGQTQAQMGLAAAQSTGDAGRSMATLGQGIAGPLNQFGGNMMQYELLKPLLQQGGGGNSSGVSIGARGPGAPGGISASVESPMTAPLGMSGDDRDLMASMGRFSLHYG